MLINFTQSYMNDINIGYAMLGQIHCSLANYEPYMGSSVQLDKLYMLSILISGIIDHLENDDNATPADNESLLLCLRSLNNSGLCGPICNPILNVRNYHNVHPSQLGEKPFIQ